MVKEDNYIIRIMLILITIIAASRILPAQTELSDTAYYNSGVAKSKLQDYNGAMQDYTTAIEINPYYSEAYYARSLVRNNLNDYNGAIDDCNKAIELNPEYADAYFNRGLVKILLDDKSEGCQDIHKAVDLGYQDAYEFIEVICK